MLIKIFSVIHYFPYLQHSVKISRIILPKLIYCYNITDSVIMVNAY